MIDHVQSHRMSLFMLGEKLKIAFSFSRCLSMAVIASLHRVSNLFDSGFNIPIWPTGKLINAEAAPLPSRCLCFIPQIPSYLLVAESKHQFEAKGSTDSAQHKGDRAARVREVRREQALQSQAVSHRPERQT